MGVLENINIHDSSGNALTSTGNALDINLKTSGATVTVAQPTGSNLHAVVDSGTLTLVDAVTSITDPVTVVQPTASSLQATVRNQDGAGNNLTSTGSALDSNLKTIGGTAVQTGTGTSGAGIPRVTVANDSKVQPWDGTNSAKFDATGETTADITRFGGTEVTIGQKLMASSIPIAIAVDQSPIPVSGVFNIQNGTTQSGNIPNTLNGTLEIINNDFIWSTLTLNFIAPPPNSSPVLSLGGEFQLEGSIDNVNWTALTGTLLSDTPTQVTQYTTTGFLSCAARYNLAGFPWIRLRTTNPFTGTISVQQALTTAIGDEVSFTTAKIVDDSGHTVDLTPPAQYTEGLIPSVSYFQGGLAILTGFADTQIIDPANAAFVLPKRSQIGNTVVVAVVIQGTGSLTAANLAPMTLSDTAGSSYTLAEMYDSTVTSAGQAIAIYVKTITAVDNEGQIGFLLEYGGTIGSGQPITSITGISLLAHEYSGVTLTGDAFTHVLTPSTATGPTSASIAPGDGYLVYSLISGQDPNNLLTKTFTIPTGGHLNTSDFQALSSDPVQACTGDNLSSYEALGYAWDWVTVKLPVATTGTIMMGRLTSPAGLVQPIKIDATSGGVVTTLTGNTPSDPYFVAVTNPVGITVSSENFPVQLQDGASEPISSTGGSLNVNVTNSPLPVTQSGAWSITATNTSVGTPGQVLPAGATVMGAVNSVAGGLEVLQLDANNNLNVNIAAGATPSNPAASATGSAVPVDASYTGLDIGGNLVGQTGLSLTNAKAAAVAIVDANGNQVTNLAEQQYLNGSATGSSVTGTVALGLSPAGSTTALSLDALGHLNANIVNTPSVTVSGTPTVSISGTPAVTVSGTPVVTVSGTVSTNVESNGTAITNTSGALDVNIKSGAASGTQYAAGTAVATPTGTVAMGWDGTDVRSVSTDTSGNQNVNLFVGGSPNGVLHPVTISASGSANSASNPIAISVADGSGNTSIMTAVGTAPAATTRALPVASVLYAGATPTAIGTPVAAGTGTLSGNALTCNSPVYVGAAPASASNRLPVSASLTDGTTAVSGAVSPLGSAPLGNAVLNVNTVSLPSAASGAAMNAKFINSTGAAVNIKNSAGNLYGLSLTNSTAAPAFVEFFNVNGTPTLGTTAVVFCVLLPASGNVTISPTTLGLMNFSTGIGFAATTGENGTTAAAVTGMVFYQ